MAVVTETPRETPREPAPETAPAESVAATLAELAARVAELKAGGKRVVLTSGSFDLIHVGHVRYLERAKACGDFLVVGVDDDAKIRRRKTPDRPLVPQAERMQMLTYQRPVDLVYLKRDDDPRWGLIKAARPDVLVLTADHEYGPADLVALGEFCGEIEVVERQASVTTSERIRQMCLQLAPMLQPHLADRLPEWILPEFEQVMAETFQQLMAETFQQVMTEFERKLRDVLREKLVNGLPELIDSALRRR
jgi:D-beta-D-heptose 7-phosphate kinase/D-beta-D-heptose 1-phosphate adenosyltransferase